MRARNADLGEACLLLGSECDGFFFARLGAKDSKRDSILQVAQRDAAFEVHERGVLGVADRGNFVARANACLVSGRARSDLRDDARNHWHTQAEGNSSKNAGEDDVHNHAGRDDRHALRHGFGEIATAVDGKLLAVGAGDFFGGKLGVAAEFGFAHLFGDVRRVVVLAEHFDIAAQRENADSVLGLAPLATDLVAADVEADEELVAFDAAHFGNGEVAQFMDKNHGTQTEANLQNNKQPLQRSGGKN